MQCMELMEKLRSRGETLAGEMEGIQGENRESMKRRLSAPSCSKYDGDKIKKDREWNAFIEKGKLPGQLKPQGGSGRKCIHATVFFVACLLYTSQALWARGRNSAEVHDSVLSTSNQ